MAKTILIVEDDAMNMRLFNDLLQANDYGTIQATDGETAFDLAREHRPDLILMDVRLPGISGLDVTKKLKADPGLKDIPVVAVSALAMQGDREKILADGCDGYIAKPVSVPDFLATVASFLARSPLT